MSYAAQFGASLELPVHLRRSLTSDRGVEMARHGEFARASGTPVFFCDPASPGSDKQLDTSRTLNAPARHACCG